MRHHSAGEDEHGAAVDPPAPLAPEKVDGIPGDASLVVDQHDGQALVLVAQAPRVVQTRHTMLLAAARCVWAAYLID